MQKPLKGFTRFVESRLSKILESQEIHRYFSVQKHLDYSKVICRNKAFITKVTERLQRYLLKKIQKNSWEDWDIIGQVMLQLVNDYFQAITANHYYFGKKIEESG